MWRGDLPVWGELLAVREAIYEYLEIGHRYKVVVVGDAGRFRETAKRKQKL